MLVTPGIVSLLSPAKALRKREGSLSCYPPTYLLFSLAHGPFLPEYYYWFKLLYYKGNDISVGWQPSANLIFSFCLSTSEVKKFLFYTLNVNIIFRENTKNVFIQAIFRNSKSRDVRTNCSNNNNLPWWALSLIALMVQSQ